MMFQLMKFVIAVWEMASVAPKLNDVSVWEEWVTGFTSLMAESCLQFVLFALNCG